jgi:hypothetical protein
MKMPECTADLIVRNLTEALNRLRDDLDRVELWTVALSSFQQSPPEYRPDNQHILPVRKPVRTEL